MRIPFLGAQPVETARPVWPVGGQAKAGGGTQRFGVNRPSSDVTDAADTARFRSGIPGSEMGYLPGAETYRPTFDKLFASFTPGALFRKLNPGQPHDSDLLAWAFTRRKQEPPTMDRARTLAARLSAELMAALDDAALPQDPALKTRQAQVDMAKLMETTGLRPHQAERLAESGHFLLGYANHPFESFRYGVARFFYDLASAVVENRQQYFDDLKRRYEAEKAAEEKAWREKRKATPQQ